MAVAAAGRSHLLWRRERARLAGRRAHHAHEPRRRLLVRAGAVLLMTASAVARRPRLVLLTASVGGEALAVGGAGALADRVAEEVLRNQAQSAD